jgi:Na+/H+-dicarboxylate symporter
MMNYGSVRSYKVDGLGILIYVCSPIAAWILGIVVFWLFRHEFKLPKLDSTLFTLLLSAWGTVGVAGAAILVQLGFVLISMLPQYVQAMIGILGGCAIFGFVGYLIATEE